MKRILRSFPIEAYAIVLPSLAVAALPRIFPGLDKKPHIEILTSNVFFGSSGIKMLIMLSVATVIFALLFMVIDFMQSQLGKKSFELTMGVERLKGYMFKYAAGIIYIFVMLGSIFVGSATAVAILFSNVARDKVISVSGLLMEADKIFFGTYPGFILQAIGRLPALEALVLSSYFMLYYVFVILLVALLFADKSIFRFLIMSYFFCYALSMPIWFLGPAISPQEMYRRNTLSVNIEPEIAGYIERYQPSIVLAERLDKLDKYWIDPDGSRLAVSSNPSMHIAWGLVFVFVAAMLWRPLLIVLVPWFSLNALGTLYTFQHYAVDLVSGVVIALIAMILAKQLLKLDKKRYYERYQFFSVFEILNLCVQKARESFYGAVSRIRKK